MGSRRPSAFLWLFPLGFLLATIAVLWHGLVTLPHEYADLAGRGVPVRVQITACGPGVGGDSHGYGCRLQTDYRGHEHRWRVDRDVRAQAGPDGAANGLVDPVHPDRSALAEDVDRRSGVRGSTLLAAAFLASLAVLTAAAAGWRQRQAQKPV